MSRNSPTESEQFSGFWYLSRHVRPPPQSILEHFDHLGKKKSVPHPSAAALLFPSLPSTSPPPPLSTESPILDFPISGVTYYVAFCDWLLSRSMCLMSAHVVAWIGTLFLFTAK